jgi:hypothetical protein
MFDERFKDERVNRMQQIRKTKLKRTMSTGNISQAQSKLGHKTLTAPQIDQLEQTEQEEQSNE